MMWTIFGSMFGLLVIMHGLTLAAVISLSTSVEELSELAFELEPGDEDEEDVAC